MAKNTSLYFRIVEGRNLPAKDVSGTSDPYCIVKVDNEVVARTATIWKNLNPFWGEEYTLHMPMGFHTLTFYVMDEDTIGHDDVIGKISLSKEVIANQSKGLDNWLNLTRVDPDEEVQGEIHVALELHREAQRTCGICFVLHVSCRDLAPRDITGTSDPFTRILYNNLSAETSIIKKTRFPHWDETLELCLDEAGESELGSVTLEVWDWDMVGKNDFLGKVEIPMSCLYRTPLLQGWFRLLPLGNSEDDAGGKLGALRLKVRLAEERILPSLYYQPLIDLLVEAVISPVDDLTPLTLLEEVTTVESRQDIAMTLVKIYLGQGLVVPFLDYLNTREVHHTTDPNTLFRSNSLASKAMEQFMKAVGMIYLHEVLKPIINHIFEEKKYIELDPSSEAEVRDSSVGMLQMYLTTIMEAIVNSVSQCPLAMRVVFKQLHKRVEEQFPEPENEDVKYLAISGFFFLRFFAPAILTPKLFHLRDHHADTRTSRTLLLLAKALQSVGNLGLQLGHGKEQWMAPLHPIILCSVASIKDFLDKLIDVDHDVPQRAAYSPSVTIREGFLQKHKADGPQLLKRFAFKKRYFWLSSETLSYAKTPDSCQKVVLSFASLPQNVNELNQWLSAIRKASIYNEHMLPSFHPGAHHGNKWTCCLQADRTALGCSRTHSAVTLGDWSDPLDPDAEAQTIYKELLQVEVPMLERSERFCAVASRLLNVVLDLERAHTSFQRKEREEANSLILPQ
uniref:RAS protein activator like 1 n=1 Tax=Electrophorus electricus TaxID=8005 RepID=A0A4W4EGB0_ELEEL